MNKRHVKLIAMVMVAILGFSATPVFSFAVEQTGTYGPLTYSESMTDITITDCDSSQIVGAYEIPSDINGKPVTSIGRNSFSYCSQLTEVKIPNSVETIGTRAFYNCTALSNIAIGDNVKSIGDEAFTNPYKQTHEVDLTLGNSIETIGAHAFEYCAIDHLVIPDSVKRIGALAFSFSDGADIYIGKSLEVVDGHIPGYSLPQKFWDSKKISSIEVSPYNEMFSSEDGVLFNKEQTELIKYPVYGRNENYTVPKSVKVIGYSAFSGYRGNQITLPEGLEELGRNAFNSSSHLERITIPYGIKEIPANCFAYCFDLIEITIPEAVKVINNSAFGSSPQLIIYGYNNSYASWYAVEHGIPFVCIGEASDPYYPPSQKIPDFSDLPTLSDDEARSFLGFIYNSSEFYKSDLSQNVYFKLLTGRLPDDDILCKEVSLAFLTTISSNLTQYVSESNQAKEYLRSGLINYLSEQLAGMPSTPEEIINEYSNELMNNIKTYVQDTMTGFLQFSGKVSADDLDRFIGNLDNIMNTVIGIKDLPSKIQNFVDGTVAATQAFFFPLEHELNGRYRYFNSYLSNRKIFDADSEAFKLLQDFNAFAAMDSNFLSIIFDFLPNTASWYTCRDIINKWAEYTYSLGALLRGESIDGLFGGGGFDHLQIQCPVDVFVYDQAGHLVGSIENDQITLPIQEKDSDKLFMSVVGDSKHLFIKTGGYYTIKIQAAEDGLMNVTSSHISTDQSETRRSVTSDIQLTAGKQFFVNPNPMETGKIDYYTVYDTDAEGAYSNAIPVNNTWGDDAPEITVSATALSGGEVLGIGTYHIGDTVSLTALAYDGYVFSGWYDENNVKFSEDKQLVFTASENRSLEARFAENKAQQPIASIPGGTYSTSQQIVLTTPTEGAEIYYTLDGTTPDHNATLYTQPIVIDSTCTLKAISIKPGMKDSDVSTFDYQIQVQAVNSILISPERPTVKLGEQQYFTAIVESVNGADDNVTWRISGNTSTGTNINKDGVLTVNKDEKSDLLFVTAISNFNSEKTATVQVRVDRSLGFLDQIGNLFRRRVTDVSINYSELNLAQGKSQMLQAVISPSNAKNKGVLWSSSDSSVVSVDGGLVTAHSPGDALITVTTEDGGYIASCIVHSRADKTLLNGMIELIETSDLHEADFEPALWSELMRTLDLAKEVANETYVDQGAVDKAYGNLFNVYQSLGVYIPVENVKIGYEGSDVKGEVLRVKIPWTTLYKNNSIQLSVITNPDNSQYKTVEWSITGNEITVDQTGKCTPTGKGVGGRSGWVTVKVTDYAGNTFTHTIKVRFVKWDWQK